ncbi:MAG: GNAT family N-acetyltransferase [Oscillospiraceae bacterium]|nr:GNAT family N-acetyltransferase [Oscillospiraceae bacterium]
MTDAEKTQAAIHLLQREPLMYIDMLEPLRRGYAEVLYVGKDGVQLEVRGTVMQAAADEAAAERLAERAPQTPLLFVAHSKADKAAFEKCRRASEKFPVKGCNPCRFAIYTGKKPLPVSPEVSIRQLTLDYAPAISRQYHLFDNLSYIKKLLQKGVFYGAFFEDELAGFIGEHAEGSLGMLEVYPKFRRRGVATALEADAANRSLAKGQVPFGDVIVGNNASFALQHSMGFEMPEKLHYWLLAD